MTLNSKYTYWYFKNVLTEKFCNDVIKRGNAEKESLALTGDLQNKNPESLSDKDENDLKKIRDQLTEKEREAANDQNQTEENKNNPSSYKESIKR